MKLLLDTHLVLWAAGSPERLPEAARQAIDDPYNEVQFSAASLCEIVMKNGLDRVYFMVEPHALRRGLLDSGYNELTISCARAMTVATLPPIRCDWVDRPLVAQALSEGVMLLTADQVVAKYPGPIRHV